ncbi:MAG: diaminopimelate decarboxylase [Candidatus Rokubacteria bacterium]|nr:diaminopimelate decarboxylase [Candidatus Rokubacteria bacterium]
MADAVGTPAYVYSRAALVENYRAYDAAVASHPHLIAYAMKANANLGVVATLAREGAGAEVFSGGELFRALKAGVHPKKILFAGPGKTREEMRDALKADILMFNVESAGELALLDRVAQELGTRAPVALRVNPDVDPETHPYIATGLRSAKFGIPVAQALEEYRKAAQLPGIEVVGVHMHIGSQLTKVAPVADALARVVDLVRTLGSQGIPIRVLDVGGGLGIRYRDEDVPTPGQYAEVVLSAVRPLGVTLILEPGRSVVGNAGILLTRVLYNKETPDKRFVVVDAAMNDLIRPVREVRGRASLTVDVVGPVCESGDFLAKDRALPAVDEGELLAVMSAGAYGFVMASNYNARPRAPEVLVDGSRYAIVRRRESYEDLIAGESA